MVFLFLCLLVVFPQNFYASEKKLTDVVSHFNILKHLFFVVDESEFVLLKRVSKSLKICIVEFLRIFRENEVLFTKLKGVKNKGFLYLQNDHRYKYVHNIPDVSWVREYGNFYFKKSYIPPYGTMFPQPKMHILIVEIVSPCSIEWDKVLADIKQGEFLYLAFKFQDCDEKSCCFDRENYVEKIMSEIPQSICRHVVGIDLSETYVSEMPESLVLFPYLQVCRLDNNQIKKLEKDFFDHFSDLTVFSISNNKLENFSGRHRKIMELDISGNNICFLQIQMSNLQVLDLTKNKRLLNIDFSFVNKCSRLKKLTVPRQDKCDKNLENLTKNGYTMTINKECMVIEHKRIKL